MSHLNQSYWDERYESNNTPWTLNCVSPAITEFLRVKNPSKEAKILIPGAGLSPDAHYLYSNGFKNVFVLDLSKTSIEQFISNYPEFPKDQIIHENFFEHHDQYDLIFEQTFFCALPLSINPKYPAKVTELLQPKGILFGLFFLGDLSQGGPPYLQEKGFYSDLFSPLFKFIKLELFNKSITPRKDKELFFIFEKK
ncbi:MAG: SAM-dependent methyltransferase [Flavobacteriaceae bacterium]